MPRSAMGLSRKPHKSSCHSGSDCPARGCPPSACACLMRSHDQSSGQQNNFFFPKSFCDLTIVISLISFVIGRFVLPSMAYFVRCSPIEYGKSSNKGYLMLKICLLGACQFPSTTPSEACLRTDLAHMRPKAACRRIACTSDPIRNSRPKFSKRWAD